MIDAAKQTENEAVQYTDLRTRRTPVRLAFANHMNRFVAGDRAPALHIRSSASPDWLSTC
jgi:hypothetical protein